MAEIIRITYQFKRGTKQRWLEVNPVLKAGEPGWEVDTHRLKIGDGITPWGALPYVETGADEILTVQTLNELPQPGDASRIYRVVQEKLLFQWNGTTYESLGSSGGGFDPLSIESIQGGNANG